MAVTLNRINMPPMVGVPIFFRCAAGPSLLTIWPHLSQRRNGISTGPKTALAKKEIITAVILPIISPSHKYHCMPK